MKKAACILLASLVLAPAGIAPAMAVASKARALARLATRDGREVGTANFVATSHGVLIELDLKSLTPGQHAIHIHKRLKKENRPWLWTRQMPIGIAKEC
jgi:Cu/Zn superoxide dismutase